MNHEKIPGEQVAKTVNEEMQLEENGSLMVIALDNGKTFLSITDGTDTMSIVVGELPE